MLRLSLLTAISFFFAFNSYADVKPNGLFTNNAVLQRGINIPVWGTASEGESVTVSLNGQSVSTVASQGKWMVYLQPMSEGGPYEMTIKGNNTITYKNILIGEVWLASGQSNMERQLGLRKGQQPIKDWNEEVQLANYPNIRMITIPRKSSATPEQDVQANWMVCDTSSVVNFSAVAYFFARDLQAKINVPIGIIHSSVGGTPAEFWISNEAMMANDTTKQIMIDADQKKKSALNGLYNGMIAPLVPYGIKGVIWYQGESNRADPTMYKTLFPAMIHDWRAKWKIGDFPFLFVQVAPFKDMTPEIRESQLISFQRTQYTAMVVTTDCGNCQDIHPSNKQPVGNRLSLAALALAYGEKNEYMGPIISSATYDGKKIMLSFTHASKGFLKNAGEIKGFEIGTDANNFVPAKASIKGKKVILSSESEVLNPIYVRYGWGNCMEVNFYNKEGLPASPFRFRL
jgi:sialate O-acetylesterase